MGHHFSRMVTPVRKVDYYVGNACENGQSGRACSSNAIPHERDQVNPAEEFGDGQKRYERLFEIGASFSHYFRNEDHYEGQCWEDKIREGPIDNFSAAASWTPQSIPVNTLGAIGWVSCTCGTRSFTRRTIVACCVHVAFGANIVALVVPKVAFGSGRIARKAIVFERIVLGAGSAGVLAEEVDRDVVVDQVEGEIFGSLSLDLEWTRDYVFVWISQFGDENTDSARISTLKLGDVVDPDASTFSTLNATHRFRVSACQTGTLDVLTAKLDLLGKG